LKSQFPVFKFFLKKTAKLSSDYADSYGAAMAVDGIYEPTKVMEKSSTHSQRETRPCMVEGRPERCTLCLGCEYSEQIHK